MVLPATARSVFTGLDELRNFAKLSIYSAYDPDASANLIINDMRELGLGYRRQVMLEDIRSVKGLEKYEGQLRRYDPGGIIPKAWQQEVPYNLRNEGQYRYRVTVFDEEQGEIVILDRAESTNNWYTKGEAEEQMASRMEHVMREYKVRVLGVDLYEVWTKEGGNLTR